MSNFNGALRQSKLASLLSRPAAKATERIPAFQTLETTTASKHRRDWGLKSNLPQKAKSAYITYGRMDSALGFPELEYGSNWYRRLQKTKELGVAVPTTTGSNNQLYEARRKALSEIATTSENEFNHILRKVRKSRPDTRNLQTDMASMGTVRDQLCREVLGRPWKTTPIKPVPMGISYKPKGVLSNSPTGMATGKVVKGRYLPDGIAVAGYKFVKSNQQRSAIGKLHDPVNLRVHSLSWRQERLAIEAEPEARQFSKEGVLDRL